MGFRRIHSDSIIQKLFATFYYIVNIRTALQIGDPKFYTKGERLRLLSLCILLPSVITWLTYDVSTLLIFHFIDPVHSAGTLGSNVSRGQQVNGTSA